MRAHHQSCNLSDLGRSCGVVSSLNPAKVDRVSACAKYFPKIQSTRVTWRFFYFLNVAGDGPGSFSCDTEGGVGSAEGPSCKSPMYILPPWSKTKPFNLAHDFHWPGLHMALSSTLSNTSSYTPCVYYRPEGTGVSWNIRAIRRLCKPSICSQKICWKKKAFIFLFSPVRSVN